MNDLVIRKKLSEQLAAWWLIQTDFKTRKAMASFLKVHRDTIGDYFSGKRFPKSEFAHKLYELTKIACLKPDGDSPPETASQESFALPSLYVAARVEDASGKSLKGKLGQPSRKVEKGVRNIEKPVVISLQRTSCPFCMHSISRYRSCGHCGQSFVWANVPSGYGEPSQMLPRNCTR